MHRAEKVKAWEAKRSDKIELHYLPSYSSDLNPNGYLNRDIKAELPRRPSSRRDGQLKAQAKTQMRRLQKNPERVKKYFNSNSIRYAAYNVAVLIRV